MYSAAFTSVISFHSQFFFSFNLNFSFSLKGLKCNHFCLPSSYFPVTLNDIYYNFVVVVVVVVNITL